MQAPNWFIFFFIYLTFAGCPSSAASLGDVGQGEISKPMASVRSKGAMLEAFLNYILHIYPSSDTMRWNNELIDPDEFTQGTPKRLYYAPRAGKRSTPVYEDDEPSNDEASNAASGETRWKRSVQDAHNEEDEDSRIKRETSQPEDNNEDDLDSKSWWWSKAAVRRSPFSPRLGKRDEVHYGSMYDTDSTDMDNLMDDDLDNDLMDSVMTEDYTDEIVSPQRLALRSALVPRLGKKDFAFSPRLGKRGTAFIPRLGKRGDFAFSPRLGKRGDFAFSPRLGKKADFAFSPRLGKKADFAFSPRLGKRGDFAFSPRLGKRADFAFSPRLGKRGDFAFSPRLGKKSDFAFNPRLGKRGNAFSPRLGKRDTPEDAWGEDSNDFPHLQQRSFAFSPRLG